ESCTGTTERERWHVAERAPLLSVRELKKTYAGTTGPVEAVGSIPFDVHPGELVRIVGPAACDKNTLLQRLSGLLAPTSGSVRLDGTEVTAPPEKVALVFQDYGRSLYPWLTVRDNGALPLKARGVPRRERIGVVERALEEVDLGQAMNKYPW